MSSCHTLQGKKPRPREPKITWQDLEIQSLVAEMLSHGMTCSYAALLWSDKGLPPAAQLLPTADLQMYWPAFLHPMLAPLNPRPGVPSPHISQSRGASRSKITQVSSPKASPAGQGHPPGVATRFVLLSECLHQGTPGSPTATAGARLQSSSPPCLTLWELLAPPSDPDTSCFLSL